MTVRDPRQRLDTRPCHHHRRVVLNTASPYLTLANLLDAACAKPRDLTLASLGPASVHQIAFETLKRAAAVDRTFVPYPGIAPAVNALLGACELGVRYLLDSVGATECGLSPPLHGRGEPLPEVPSVAGAGYDHYGVDFWLGLFAPVKTSKETISPTRPLVQCGNAGAWGQGEACSQGLYPVEICGVDFAALLRKQYDDFGPVIREANIKAE
jgi:tripartite-type tricarboxylate transporter receptor subunit TctC